MKLLCPSGDASTAEQEITSASSGPRLHHSINFSIGGPSPSASMYTLPSGSFCTKPEMPSSSAFALVEARKNTPCTLPEIRMLKCFFMERNDSFPSKETSHKILDDIIGAEEGGFPVPDNVSKYLFIAVGAFGSH
jgi:hypothetical protein